MLDVLDVGLDSGCLQAVVPSCVSPVLREQRFPPPTGWVVTVYDCFKNPELSHVVVSIHLPSQSTLFPPHACCILAVRFFESKETLQIDTDLLPVHIVLTPD